MKLPGLWWSPWTSTRDRNQGPNRCSPRTLSPLDTHMCKPNMFEMGLECWVKIVWTQRPTGISSVLTFNFMFSLFTLEGNILDVFLPPQLILIKEISPLYKECHFQDSLDDKGYSSGEPPFSFFPPFSEETEDFYLDPITLSWHTNSTLFLIHM